MTSDLTKFENLIQERSGLVFKGSQADKLVEGIREMMTNRGIASYSEYYEMICEDHKEFYKLISLLTTNETYFYREPAQLKVFSERLIPSILAKKKVGEKIKILCAGCSNGAEPYSLAIALSEKYGGIIMQLFDIIGFDIDAEAIHDAKQGIFWRQAFRSIDENLKQSYFEKFEQNGYSCYKLKKSIKESVVFETFNLLSDSYPEKFHAVDIIFYRNVSIYFEAEKQKRIFKKLSQILNTDGYLLMSSTETLPHDLKILSLIEIDGLFLYHKSSKPPDDRKTIPEDKLKADIERAMKRLSSGPSLKPKPKPVPLDKQQRANDSRVSGVSIYDKLRRLKSDQTPTEDMESPAMEMQSESPDKRYKDALNLAVKKKYQEALNITEKLIETGHIPVKALTLKAGILVNTQQFEEAKSVCTEALEKDPMCLEANLLLGLVARLNNNPDEALNQFRKTLYIDSSCWLAHFHLAEIYHATGDDEPAYSEYKTTVRLLEKGSFEEYGLDFFNFMFSAEQVLHMSLFYLNKLKKNEV